MVENVPESCVARHRHDGRHMKPGSTCGCRAPCSEQLPELLSQGRGGTHLHNFTKQTPVRTESS